MVTRFERQCVAGGAILASLVLVALSVRIRGAANDARLELQVRQALLGRLENAQQLAARGQKSPPDELEVVTELFPGARLQQVQAGDAVVLVFGKPMPAPRSEAVAGASPVPSGR